MKAILFAGAGCFVAGVAIALLQLWFAPWSAAVFFKLEITLGGIFLALVAVWFTRREYGEYRRQQDDDSLDR